MLIPKGGGNYHGIAILGPIWKVIESIVDWQLNVFEFNDSLLGFQSGRGTGTTITEDKLTQQLSFLEQEPWYMAFIDLKKAFDTME